MLIKITTINDFNYYITKNHLVICYYTAKWCKIMSTIIENLSEDNLNIKFLKIDVDDSSELVTKQCITSMPTFEAYINGRLSTIIKGADKQKLYNMVEFLNADDSSDSSDF